MYTQLFSLRMMVRVELESFCGKLFSFSSICIKIPYKHTCKTIGGCFVTKVSPDGSAARSRRVEVGDQLASINGTSSSKMKVDDICDAIRRSSDLSQIKLVFVRYIGPFRPFRESLQSEHIFNNIDDTTANNERTLNTSPNKKPMKIKNAFRLFGKGKKNNKN